MESIIIDGEAVGDYTLENETTIGDVAQSLVAWLKNKELYCFNIAIDNTPVTLDMAHEWGNREIDAVRVISVDTVSPHALREYIPKINSVPVLLQTKQGREAMRIVGDASILISLLIRAVPNSPAIASDTFKAHLHELKQSLEELATGLQANDTILMSDVLEYEIVPKLELLLGHFS